MGDPVKDDLFWRQYVMNENKAYHNHHRPLNEYIRQHQQQRVMTPPRNPPVTRGPGGKMQRPRSAPGYGRRGAAPAAAAAALVAREAPAISSALRTQTPVRGGDRVRITGMAHRKELNGMCASVIEDLPDASGRVCVELTPQVLSSKQGLQTQPGKVMRILADRLLPEEEQSTTAPSGRSVRTASTGDIRRLRASLTGSSPALRRPYGP